MTWCQAAAELRLMNSTLGPVSIAAGGSVAAPLLEAYNAGGGDLTLGIRQISASWITVAAGAATACKTTRLAFTCFTIQIHLNVASLAASSTPYAGNVTLTAPNNAIDAAQTIAVLAQLGGAVPSSVAVNIAPGNAWLGLALQGIGSFRSANRGTVA